MHTSTRLTAADFQFWQETGAGNQPISFAAFCPNYHELDRVGVVSLRLEDGVCQTGRTLLALTTAFYDRQRAKRRDFFDYPQHFAFVGVTAAGIQFGSTCGPLTNGSLPNPPRQPCCNKSLTFRSTDSFGRMHCNPKWGKRHSLTMFTKCCVRGCAQFIFTRHLTH